MVFCFLISWPTSRAGWNNVFLEVGKSIVFWFLLTWRSFLLAEEHIIGESDLSFPPRGPAWQRLSPGWMTFGFCTISPPTKSDFVLWDKILKRLCGQILSKRWVFFWQNPSNLQSEIPSVSFVIHLDRPLYLSVMFLQHCTFGFIG